MIDAKQLKAELEDVLLRGADIMLDGAKTITAEQLRLLMRERAANLAMAYDGRVLSFDEIDAVGRTLEVATDITKIYRDTYGNKKSNDPTEIG